MPPTLAETIRETSRRHLLEGNGLLLGQCLTAVGWVGGTVPELTQEQGLVELSMADVAGGGIAVGAALSGRRPIYVVRYQGFMWYNAASIVNYAAKSKEMWDVPCPLFVRAIAMEGGGIGPVAASSHHGMILRMPGIPVCAPMTPGEWSAAWRWFMEHDDPLYVSEHRRSYATREETPAVVSPGSKVTIAAISAARLNAAEAVVKLAERGIEADLFPLVWLKPFEPEPALLSSLRRTGLGLVIDSDFEIAAASRSIAYDLMHATGAKVFAMGLADRTSGFAPHLENLTPSSDRIAGRVMQLAGGR